MKTYEELKTFDDDSILFYYFVESTPIMQAYQEKEFLNYEYMSVYPKFQIVATTYLDKTCYMA